MKPANLCEQEVAITVSDPWEFSIECGVAPFTGKIISQKSGAMVVRLFTPCWYDGKHLASVIVRVRHTGVKMDAILDGKKLAVNFIFSTSEDGSLEQRGENAVDGIGTVRLRSACNPGEVL